VLAVYGLLALANDPGGYLGTDTGAKVATIDAMVEGGTLSPDVGYWAEEWDPDGTYHPLLDTIRNDDGAWVNVTTLPMLVAAWPLYAVGGYRLALVWPMVGALLAAFACRDIAERLGDEGTGWRAFWLTALGSPLAIYALDLWEHSLGAGLMLSAFGLLFRFLDGGGWWRPAVAGLALGASASMRTETFVVAFVFVAASCLVLASRRSWADAFGVGALAVGGFGLSWLGNSALEGALGGNSRADRATGVATSGPWSELSVRVEEALITWFDLPAAAYPGGVLLGVVAVSSLVLSGWLQRRGEDRGARLAMTGCLVAYVAGLSSGLSFVPGALVTAPVAALLLLTPTWDQRRRFVLGAALVATILTWMFQFTGGAGPQWGGRYILTPTLLLLSLGASALPAVPKRVGAAAVLASVLVTLFGFAWLWQRSHAVDRFFEALSGRSEDVIVSTNGFLVREAGPAYDDRRYLSVGRGGDLDGAVEVARRSGAAEVTVLTEAALPPSVAGRRRESEQLSFLGVPIYLHTYELSG